MSDVVNHFHHNDCLADACAPEHAHLTAAGERNQKINNLNACFQNVNRCILLQECR